MNRIKKLIELFENCDTVTFTVTGCGEESYKTIEFKNAIELLEEQLNNEWISIEERLPKEYCENSKLYNFQRVLATLKNGCVCEVWWTGTGFRLAEKFKFVELINNPVIAWRELPEPYEE